MAKPTEEQISARAKEIWEAEGRPDGRATAHWLQAEQELQKSDSAPPAAAAVEKSAKSKPNSRSPIPAKRK